MTARIHSESEPAALDALNTFSFSKSGWVTKTFSLLIFLYGMALILSYLNYLTRVISFALSKFFLEYVQKSWIFYMDPGSFGVNLTLVSSPNT